MRSSALPAAPALARRRYLPLLLWLLAAAGCAKGEDAAAPAIVAADSAGVRVLTLAGDPRALPALRVGDTLPLQGAPEDFFSGNPSTAFSLRDGRLLLSDGRNVAVFGASGEFSGRFSRTGQGPGEIGFLSQIWEQGGDSLWTFDGSNRRLSLFAPSLEFVRSVQQPTTSIERGLSVWGGLSGDTTAVLSFLTRDAEPSPDVQTTRVSFGIWVMGGGDPVVGAERPFAQIVTPNSPGEGGFVVMMQPPFGHQAQWRPLGRCMVYGYSDQWRFEVQAPDDSLRLRDVALIRAPQDPADAVTPERREAFIEGMLGVMGAQQRPQFEPLYRNQMPFPDSTPHFSRVFASRDGAFWVQRFRGTTTDVPDHWTVVDLATPRAWRLDIPAGSRLLAVDSARALVATKDEDDVETQSWWSLPELAGIQPPTGCRTSR